jgi:hypothetical protein
VRRAAQNVMPSVIAIKTKKNTIAMRFGWPIAVVAACWSRITI